MRSGSVFPRCAWPLWSSGASWAPGPWTTAWRGPRPWAGCTGSASCATSTVENSQMPASGTRVLQNPLLLRGGRGSGDREGAGGLVHGDLSNSSPAVIAVVLFLNLPLGINPDLLLKPFLGWKEDPPASSVFPSLANKLRIFGGSLLPVSTLAHLSSKLLACSC